MTSRRCESLNIVELKPDIYWVGAIDWDLRNFHGYLTQRGSTYNSYLIVDEKIVLVDTVKSHMYDEMLARISRIVDPGDIDYIISNHVELDHSGSIPKLKELCPEAKVITSTRGEKGLNRHFKTDLGLQVMESGSSLDIGKRTLHFVHIPMVHWPDSMVTYIPEDKLLLPNDAFGQHIATHERFDDEVGWHTIHEEAAKYYANIVMPYGDQVKKAIGGLVDLEIDMIGPSHGLILRSYIGEMMAQYQRWVDHDTDPRAVIIYDSMWGSTAAMAYQLYEGLLEGGVPVVMRNLKTNHISDIMTDVMTSRAVIIGTATINNNVLPTVGAMITYLKGLKPKKRIGFAFGSYGWNPRVLGDVEAFMDDLGWSRPIESININYVPDPEELREVKAMGLELAKHILE
jgi:flavorubredoxin